MDEHGAFSIATNSEVDFADQVRHGTAETRARTDFYITGIACGVVCHQIGRLPELVGLLSIIAINGELFHWGSYEVAPRPQ
ncbi:hypothetical protein [Nocardia noduli]|uniref:hypothetical protein n=1 Tax=Nocardia noduli TaxID=2815722 RepID=UPI001C23C4FB|nr:hypothetical protein [Nocardia noduli]